MKRFPLLLLFCAVAMSAHAKENTVCASVSAAVEKGQKDLAAAKVDGFFSGPSHEAVREAKSANALSGINANLAILQAKKCPMPKDPIDAKWYVEAALACEIGKSKAEREGRKDMPEECNRDNWTRKAN